MTPGLCIQMYIQDRVQVNKALYTCKSWYEYAAMFGSSTDNSDQCQTSAYVQSGAGVRLFNLFGRFVGQDLQPEFNSTRGLRALRQPGKLAECWHLSGQLACSPFGLPGDGRVRCVCVRVLVCRSHLPSFPDGADICTEFSS